MSSGAVPSFSILPKTENAIEHTTNSISTFNTLRIKFGVLIGLCFQNVALALMCRYSKGILKEKYSSSEVMFVAESLKFVISGYLAYTDTAETDAVGHGYSKLYWLIFNSQKVIVLVILYSIANLLSFYSLARLDASVYTVFIQLKSLSTAFFAVIILSRYISITKWRALILLVLGCLLVASPSFNGSNTKQSDTSIFETILGICAVIAMVLISGYSAVYFESILKKAGEKITIWERNFQLAFFSAILLLIMSVYSSVTNTPDENNSDFFYGWTYNTVIISCLHAAGGLLVAATLKYADAILKTLATSGSIVLTAMLGYMFLGGYLDMIVSIGCFVTIIAISNYGFDTD